MPLQWTRALAFAWVRSLPSDARRSPLNAQPFGRHEGSSHRRRSAMKR
jgi:hypothetical protein